MNHTKKTKGIPGKYVYFAFTIIPVVLYTFFYVVSVINGVKYSFTNWDGMAQEYDFVGFKNYIQLLKNPNFWNSMKTTLNYSIRLVVGVILTSLLLAISLNSLKRFKTFVKSIFFVPAMIGGVTIALIWDQLFYRMVPLIGQALGIEWLSQSLMMTGKTALPAVVFVQTWQAVAMPTVIFIAGLQQIPDEQYESAKIDGATAFQRFRYITMPYLLPTVTVNLVLTIKQGFTSFDYPYALTGGGPVRATEVIGILIYNDAFKNLRFSVANAEACILFVMVAIFSLTQLKLTSKGGVNQ
ncbi:sugar ABC transporter permease [Parablautia intestinalis]|jgi:raffinose/stachyose/melibiose transport system permease protein|uniref:Sugar ABC transporter permease n=1 Tax=Parablautia intestinalis TaxID=2320100 RepID=A0A3A9AM81_9FIRM|nr:sugar ABC transporter permease [Parablautia intestinalis]MCI8614130.1 sugar ABC transporter permease [Lachnospiraceae bacterium]MDE7046750.1 sugar ABC transporter permease [Lachnospiraceae bacterium]RKI92459.1 sugar ABC transporter permease [Parablautia intestinalis]